MIDLVRFTPGGISRVELARQLQLTRAAVTEIVKDLLRLGILREAQNRYGGGGQPTALEINPELGYVIGIDIGATHVTLALADFSARIIQEMDLQINIADGPQSVFAAVDRAVRQVLSAAGLGLNHIQRIGLGAPGPVVTQAGWVGTPSIMQGWDRYPLRDHLIQLFGCPVVLNNDASLGALGEWAYGAGRGMRNLVYIKAGTGIGAGLLLDGQIYYGATGSAGEIGHITLDENGPLCFCGNRGCLEELAGGRAIVGKAIAAVQAGQQTRLSAIDASEAITAQHVIAAAKKGDSVAANILSEAGRHLGIVIAGTVNVLNPNKIVIGGAISQAGDLLLEPIRQVVQQRSLRVASRNVQITTALLGKYSSVMGAVVAALSNALHDMIEKR